MPAYDALVVVRVVSGHRDIVHSCEQLVSKDYDTVDGYEKLWSFGLPITRTRDEGQTRRGRGMPTSSP